MPKYYGTWSKTIEFMQLLCSSSTMINCVFLLEFDWSAGYIHFAMKQNILSLAPVGSGDGIPVLVGQNEVCQKMAESVV